MIVLQTTPSGTRQYEMCATCGNILRFVSVKLPDGTAYGRLRPCCDWCEHGYGAPRTERLQRARVEAEALRHDKNEPVIPDNADAARARMAQAMVADGPRVCQEAACGAEFIPLAPNQRYCSRNCERRVARARDKTREMKRKELRHAMREERRAMARAMEGGATPR